MAKIFYCGGSSGRLGMLRAVISAAELSSVLSKEAKYLGKSFPNMTQTDPQNTVIEVLRDEQGQWKAGFYRAAEGPLQFEGHLRAPSNDIGDIVLRYNLSTHFATMQAIPSQPNCFQTEVRMWEDANYCWVVLCKNHWFHKNIFFRHKIPLGQTDAVTPLPTLGKHFTVRCDECRKSYTYKPKDVRRVELELPESFKPHPLFREDAEDGTPDSNRVTAQEVRQEERPKEEPPQKEQLQGESRQEEPPKKESPQDESPQSEPAQEEKKRAKGA